MARKRDKRSGSGGGSRSGVGATGAGGGKRPDFQWKDRSGKIHGKRASGGSDAPSKAEGAPKHRIIKDGGGSTARPEKSPWRPEAGKPSRGGAPHGKPQRGHFAGKPTREDRDARGPRRDDRGPRRDDRGPRNDRGPRDSRGPRAVGRDSRGGPRDSYRGGAKKRRGGSPGGPEQKLKATVDKNRKGFGFLAFENRSLEDAFVPPRDAQSLFHGDRVEATVNSDGEVTHIKVLEHRFREVVGRYTPHPSGVSRGGWVVYERKRAREEIFVPQGPLKARAGDWVRAKLEFHEKGPHTVTAQVLDIYGDVLPARADVGMIAAEYNLIEEHTEAAEREARAQKLEVPGKDLEGREDLRKTPFITIDGETARDFDDAVYVEAKKGGHVLWVAIADVSHYVTPGSALDKEAMSRGTSVYFPERAFHMLPRALSETLCSLKPNEPRLTMVARMEFDPSGKNVKTEIMEAVIQSKRRATYNEIHQEWQANQTNAGWEYKAHFDLYKILRKARSDRGSIDFDLPEAEVVVDPQGEVISIKNRSRNDAHRLIEEFMIAANEAVTVWMLKRKWPFVYRTHDEPTFQALEKFQNLAATVGVHFSFEGSASPKVMADLVKMFEGHAAQSLLNMALLRSMKQAIYSSAYGKHFGLASEAYTHFTSPIRRYPDLVVHRLLRQAVRIEKGIDRPLKPAERAALEKELAEVCEHCSYRERLASEADREAIRLKQVRAMIPKLGDEFQAKIMGMADSGFFVQIPDPYVEGMVSKDSLTDDVYEFNEERMVFFGRRKRRTFKIGDLVQVRALRADLDRRQIDFGLIDLTASPSG